MQLQEFFTQFNKVAIGFSGGVDSAFLLAMAKESGVNCVAYYVQTALQPKQRLEEVNNFVAELGVELCVIDYDVFSNQDIIANDAKRCYHCKKAMFSAILKQAKADGCDVICDGTNASDDTAGRPGYVALDELKVLSPLAICGITKTDIRQGLLRLNIKEFNKQSYSCLATRIPTLEPIVLDKLHIVERAEKALSAMGFVQFRVNLQSVAKAIFAGEDYGLALQKEQEIKRTLRDICGQVEIAQSTEKDKQFLI